MFAIVAFVIAIAFVLLWCIFRRVQTTESTNRQVSASPCPTNTLLSSDYPLVFTPDKDMALTANFKWNNYDSMSYASVGASVLVNGQVNATWQAASMINGQIVAAALCRTASAQKPSCIYTQAP